MPESESALRKKCIELSPSFPLPSSTSKANAAAAAAATAAAVAAAANRCSQNNNNNNNNNNNQIKDCERNGMKSNLRRSNDSVNKTTTVAPHFGNDDNDTIFALSSTTNTNSHDTLLKSSFDKESKNSCATANSIDIDADCDKSNSNLERAPLIQLSPNKSITLVKQNSTSLIFTKKDVNPVVHRKRITLVRSTGTHSNSEITTTATTAAAASAANSPTEGVPIISHTDESIQSPKKRHSFHWHSDQHGTSSILTDKAKRKQIKSWYAVIGSPSVRESSFDSDIEVTKFHFIFQ